MIAGKWAIALLAALGLITAAPSPGHAIRLDKSGESEKSTLVLVSCSQVDVLSAQPTPNTREYVLAGPCHLWEYPGAKDLSLNAIINATYYKKGNKAGQAYERITLVPALPYQGQGIIHQVETTSSCPHDPWFSSAAQCTLSSIDSSTVGPSGGHGGLDLAPGGLMIKAGDSSQAIPFSAGLAVEKVKTAIPPPAPVIIYPKQGESTWGAPYLLELRYERSDWYVHYEYPEEAGVVELHWERFAPGPGGEGGIWQPMWVVPKTDQINDIGQGSEVKGVMKPIGMPEGEWRVAARHAVAGWPWSASTTFWVGDPVNYALPSPQIVLPEAGSVHSTQSVDVRVKYVPAPKDPKSKQQMMSDPQMAQPQPVPIEVKLNRFGSDGNAWVPTFGLQETANTTFPVTPGPGKHRIRARIKSDLELKHPWSEWRTFYVGEEGQALKNKDDLLKKKIVESLVPVTPGQARERERRQVEGGAEERMAAQPRPGREFPQAVGPAHEDATRDLDRLAERLTPFQQNPEGRLLLREIQALRQEVAASPAPKKEAERLLRDTQRLTREVDRLEADFLRQQQRAGGPAPVELASPKATGPAEGPQPGQPSGPPQVAAIPRPAPARDPVAEQAAKELETLAKRLTALGANPEAQRFLGEVQLLQRQLGGEPGQAPAILRDAQRLSREVDRLEASLRQPTTPTRRAR